jgi:hypothetical protein
MIDETHWSYHMRRCPVEDCGGVVDDDLLVPWCCKCGKLLPDGPDGPMALLAPAGHRLQSEVPPSEEVEPPGEVMARVLDVFETRMKTN